MNSTWVSAGNEKADVVLRISQKEVESDDLAHLLTAELNSTVLKDKRFKLCVFLDKTRDDFPKLNFPER